MTYTYKTKGTCSTNIELEVEDGIVRNIAFWGGCNGNLQGLSRLVAGMPVKEVKELAFDHKQIVEEALAYIRQYVENTPSSLFTLLPRKFTASQLRALYEVIYDREFDVRNFHKKIALMDYVVPLEEKERGVAHRAARYYRFDRVIYNKRRS